ncbi:hypothetical protein [Cupriavidus gilardii]|uniref:hypothetical protein n=1 Tax=Cupriavidus gilardii TaxID=82541 RepID=UPI0021B371FF|nr:hypothetical protein [Cupriavidus gilardii]UXC35139.1 hypothetical protein N4G38_12060 [Cupriavidus gilardii]
MGLTLLGLTSYALVALAALCVVVVVAYDVVSGDPNRASAIAAWVQAIGAVAAIVGSSATVYWQMHRQRKDSEQTAQANQFRAALDADGTLWASHKVVLDAGAIVRACAIEPRKSLPQLDLAFPKEQLRMLSARLEDLIVDSQRLLQTPSSVAFVMIVKDLREELRKAHGHCDRLSSADFWLNSDAEDFVGIGERLIGIQDHLVDLLGKLAAAQNRSRG